MTTNSSVVPVQGPEQQAGVLLPYYARVAGKPVLVWRTQNGIASAVDANGKKSAFVVDKVAMERIGDAQVVTGRKGRYAVLKTAVVDLSNGAFVAKEVEAAIRAHLAKATPVAAPTAAPAVVPAVPAAPAPVSWQMWQQMDDAPTRVFEWNLQDSLSNSWNEKTLAEMYKDLAAGILECALSGNLEDVESELESLAEDVRALAKRMDVATNGDESTVTPIRWMPLTWDLQVQVDGLGDTLLWAEVSEADEAAFANGLFRASLTQERGLAVGIDRGEDEIEIVAEMPLSIEENCHFDTWLVQETFGYHPDQLTLF